MEKRKFKLKNIPLKTIPYSGTYIQLTVWTSKCYKTKRHSCLSSIRFNGPTEIYRTVSNSSNPDLFTLAMKNHYLLHYPFFSSFCFKWAWCRSNSLNPTMKMAKKREKKMNKKNEWENQNENPQHFCSLRSWLKLNGVIMKMHKHLDVTKKNIYMKATIIMNCHMFCVAFTCLTLSTFSFFCFFFHFPIFIIVVLLVRKRIQQSIYCRQQHI